MSISTRLQPTPPAPVAICLVDSGISDEAIAARHIVGGVNFSGEGDAGEWRDPHAVHADAICRTLIATAPDAAIVAVRVLDKNGALRVPREAALRVGMRLRISATRLDGLDLLLDMSTRVHQFLAITHFGRSPRVGTGRVGMRLKQATCEEK